MGKYSLKEKEKLAELLTATDIDYSFLLRPSKKTAQHQNNLFTVITRRLKESTASSTKRSEGSVSKLIERAANEALADYARKQVETSDGVLQEIEENFIGQFRKSKKSEETSAASTGSLRGKDVSSSTVNEKSIEEDVIELQKMKSDEVEKEMTRRDMEEKRNQEMNAVVKRPIVQQEDTETETTIAGLVYKDGVILGAATRATAGRTIVADRNCLNILDISPNIICYGADPHADTNMTTNMIASNITLSNLSLPQLATGDLDNVKAVLEEHLSRYLKNSSTSSSNSEGHDSTALILGRVDDFGPHLYDFDPRCRENKPPYISIGPGSSESMKTFDLRCNENMKKDEAMFLVRDAIVAGILKDFESGPAVDLFIINADNTLECRLPYRSVAVKYTEIMERFNKDLNESLQKELKTDGSLEKSIPAYNQKTIKYIVNPLKYAWRQHKLYIEKMPSKVNVLFVGMNPAGNAPSGIPFGDKTMINKIFSIDVSKKEWDENPTFLCGKKEKKCDSGRFWEFIEDYFQDMKEFRNHCFVMNVSPLIFVGTNGKNISLEKVPRTDEVLKPLIDRSKRALKAAIELMKPKLIVTVGGYAKDRVNELKIEKPFKHPFKHQCISHPARTDIKVEDGEDKTSAWIKKVTRELSTVHSTIDSA